MENNQLVKQIEDAHFAEKTCAQITKEFDKVGVSLPIPPPHNNFEHLCELVSKEVQVMLDQHPQLLAQLFYSMDLPEHQVNEIMVHASDIAYSLSEKMIIRAAQKVYLREKFS